MPLYDYKCTCGHTAEHYARIDEDTMLCPDCGGIMVRQFHSRYGINMGVGAYGYFDENLNCYIGTNAQKRRIMREQGVQEKFGKGWR